MTNWFPLLGYVSLATVSPSLVHGRAQQTCAHQLQSGSPATSSPPSASQRGDGKLRQIALYRVPCQHMTLRTILPSSHGIRRQAGRSLLYQETYTQDPDQPSACPVATGG